MLRLLERYVMKLLDEGGSLLASISAGDIVEPKCAPTYVLAQVLLFFILRQCDLHVSDVL